MTETNPQVIRDADGHVPTALELVHDFILTIIPGSESGKDVFLAYDQDAAGVVVFVEETTGDTARTFGKAVALEFPVITVTVRSDEDDYQEAKNLIKDIRYRLAAAAGYTSRGLTILDAEPRGTINPLGRDIKDREALDATFVVMTAPSYE
jgi:hypothetical protein